MIIKLNDHIHVHTINELSCSHSIIVIDVRALSPHLSTEPLRWGAVTACAELGPFPRHFLPAWGSRGSRSPDDSLSIAGKHVRTCNCGTYTSAGCRGGKPQQSRIFLPRCCYWKRPLLLSPQLAFFLPGLGHHRSTGGTPLSCGLS